MPWTTDNYPPSMKSIKSPVKRERAIHIANAILERTGDEGMAIATAQKRVKSFKKTAGDIKYKFDTIKYNPFKLLTTGGYATGYDDATNKFTIHKSDPKSFLVRLISPVHSIFHDEKTSKEISDLAVKHELDEYSYGKESPKHIKANINAEFGLNTGRHYSLGILGKESNNLANVSEAVKDHFITLRQKTGERALLHKLTGKKYGVDIFTQADIKKLEEAKPDSTNFKQDYKIQSFKTKTPTGFGYFNGIGTLTGALAGAGLVLYALEKGKINEESARIALYAGAAGGAFAGATGGSIVHKPYEIYKFHNWDHESIKM